MTNNVKLPLIAILALTATAGAKRLTNPRAVAHMSPVNNHESGQTMTAAFRDGVFQGKLSVERGEAEHLSIGRWNSDQDRASFVAGYQQAYRQEMAALSRRRR
jgi:hypothetical protein